MIFGGEKFRKINGSRSISPRLLTPDQLSVCFHNQESIAFDPQWVYYERSLPYVIVRVSNVRFVSVIRFLLYVVEPRDQTNFSSTNIKFLGVSGVN